MLPKQLIMTTLEVEIAMMKELRFNQNIVVPNVSFGMRVNGESLHECDLLCLTPSGYATEIEIKVSKSDLKKDASKNHCHIHKGIKAFWLAVPEELKDFALDHIPYRAGLYYVT